MKRNPKVGRGACPVCAEQVYFRRTTSGKLTWSCDACDSSGFAEAGGRADRRLSTGMTPAHDDDPPPAPGPAPAPAAAPKPAAPVKRRPATPFNVGAL